MKQMTEQQQRQPPPPPPPHFDATFSRTSYDVAQIIAELVSLVRENYCSRVLVVDTAPGDLLVLTENVEHTFNNGARAFVLVSRWRNRPASILIEVDHTYIGSDSENDGHIIESGGGVAAGC
jgi:hypothetical protein